jgi:hypothetical protein
MEESEKSEKGKGGTDSTSINSVSTGEVDEKQIESHTPSENFSEKKTRMKFDKEVRCDKCGAVMRIENREDGIWYVCPNGDNEYEEISLG